VIFILHIILQLLLLFRLQFCPSTDCIIQLLLRFHGGFTIVISTFEMSNMKNCGMYVCIFYVDFYELRNSLWMLLF